MDSAVITSPRPPLKPLADCRLYAFVDTAYLAGRDHRQLAHALCDGGADIIQLRAKGEPIDRIRRLAEDLMAIARSAGVWLVINDHPGLAAEVGAPAYHVGQEDFRESGGVGRPGLATVDSGLCFGLSTHSPDQARQAVTDGAHYLAVGPVFATPTKPATTPVTLDYVRWAAEHIRIPWFAIGGIALGNLDAVLAAGARRICVVSAILKSADVTGMCRAFRARLGK